MRNVFDQYDQPENRLTHALMITLANDKRLIRPFLKLVWVKRIPALNKIQLGLQCVPGQEVNSNKDGKEGLPDGCFFDQDGWAVVIEAKVQAGISVNQLKRHRKTLARYGYEQPYTYAEGKRLIRLLGDELRKRRKMVKALGVDASADGRTAITRGDNGAVWDFLPLKIGRGKQFT